MAKRDRELRHRLEELFSSEAEAPPTDSGPIEPAGSAIDPSPVEASPLESVTRALDALPPELWTTILDHLPLPVYLKDREHTWIAVNGACGDLLGRPVGMLIGHVDKEQSDEAWQIDDQVLESGQADDSLTTTTALDGSVLTRRTQRVPLTDEHGQVRYVLGIIEHNVKPAVAEQPAGAAPADNAALTRFQAIVEATPIPILITRVTDGRPLYVNARASTMFGVAREDMLNHTTLEFYDAPADRQKILAALQRDGRVVNYELRLKRPDGSALWVMLDVQPLVYNNERAVLSGFYDITARKQAETQLRTSEVLYQSLVDTIPENLCRKDKQGRFTYGNRHYCELVGLSLEELIGKTDFNIHPPHLAEKYRADDQAVMASGKPAEFLEAHEVLGASEKNYVRTIKSPLYDAQGQLIGIQIMFWDATELGRAEQALKLRTSALEAAANGVAITNRDGMLTWVNPAFTQLTGYTFEEAVGQNARILNSGRQSKEFYSTLWQTILSGQDWHGELINRRKDGREYDEEITITPVRASGDEITHFIAIMQDIRERKRTEEQVLRFKLGIERSGDAIFITDLDGTIEYVNPAFEQTYGFTAADAVGQTPRILKSGVIPQERYAHFWQTLKARGTVAGELVNKTKDGRLITIEGANTPIIDDANNLVGFLAVHRDVTARKQTEQRLAESAQRLQLLIEHVPDLIYIKNRQSQWIIANQPVADSLGVATPADLTGKSDFDFHPRELAEQFYADEQTLMTSGQSILNKEERVIGPDGNPIWLSTTKVPFRNPDGQIDGLIGIARNISANREAERRLAVAAQRLQLLIENVPDLVYVKDRQGRFLVTNQPVADLAGALSIEALIGKTDLDFFPREFAEKYYADEQAIMSSGQPLMNMEEASAGPDGKPRWLSTTKVPFRDPDGQIAGIVGIGRDITERKLIEAERERLLAVEARRSVQLQAGSEISNAAASILDPDKLLPVVVDLIRERYDLYYAGLFLIDAGGQWAELRAGTGEAGRKMLEAHHRLEIGGTSMIGGCAATGEARIALDVGAEAVRFSNPLLPRTRSEMALPLTSRGQIIGALTIQSTQLAAFTPDDINALHIMAGQIATAIENARLFQETQRRAEEQTVLFDLARSLSAQLAVDQVLQQIYQGASRLIDTANFYIGLYDPARHEVDFVINASESVVDKSITTISADQGMTGHIIRTRSSVLIKEDIDSWLKTNGLQRVGSAAQSWLGVPLMLGDHVLGVMSVQNYTTPNVYDEHDRDLLYLLGAQAAIAIQNARLFEQTHDARAAAESRLHETQILQEFSQAVSQSLDVPQVLDALVDTLQHRLAFSHIAIALIESDGEYLTMVRGVGTAAGLQGLRRPVAAVQDDITMDIIRKGRAEVIDGWDDRLSREIFEHEGHADLVRAFVPVRLRDTAVGLIEAGYPRAGRAQITPEEVRVLGGLADQMAIAIDNARLLEQVQAALGEAGQLYNASQQLSTAPDVPGMLTALVQHVSVPDVNRVVVWLYEFDTERQVTAIVTGAAWHSGAGEPPPPIGTRLPPAAMHAFQFARSRQPVITNDTEHDDRLDPATVGVLRQLHVRAVAILPLWASDRQVGMLMLQSENPHTFVDAEIRPYTSLAQQMATGIENRQLFEEARLRVTELQALNDMSRILSSQQTLEAMLSEVGERILSVLKVDTGFIALYDRQTGLIKFPFYWDEGQPVASTARPLGHGLTSRVIEDGRPLLLGQLSPEALHELGGIRQGQGDLQQSWLGVPILAGNEVIGVMSVQAHPANYFDDGSVRLLNTIAANIGTTLQKTQLFEQVQHDAEREHSLNRIATAISRSGTVNELLPTALEVTLDTIGFDCGLATLFDAGTNTLRMLAQRDLPEPLSKRLEDGLSGTLCEYVFIQGQATFLEDLTRNAPVDVSGLVALGLQSYVGIPLTYQDRTLGTLCMFGHAVRPLPDKIDVLLQSIGQQIGVGIENARLFEQTQRDAERERTLNRITSQLRNAQSVEQVLNIATQELRAATRSSVGVAEIAPGRSSQTVMVVGGHDHSITE